MKYIIPTLGAFAVLSTVNVNASKLIFEDGFETGLGNWQNTTQTDSHDWKRRWGNTTSIGTGPARGSNSSYYVYLETSEGDAYNPGDTAELIGPESADSIASLSFNYHMQGRDIGTLAVDIKAQDQWINNVWSISGSQQSSPFFYGHQNVDLSQYDATQIRFRAVAIGGFQGDIALDNIKIYTEEEIPEPPKFFDSPVQKGAAYINQAFNDSLNEDVSDANGDNLTFSKISGPEWLQISENGQLTGTPLESHIGLNYFVVSASDGVYSTNEDLHIEVIDNTPLPLLQHIDFESGLSGWNNSITNYKWTVHSGTTSSSNTGPSNGSNSAKYLYMETSSGSAYNAGNVAILESPELNAEVKKFSFDYHMYGSDIGTLAVDILTDDGWQENVWSISGQQQNSSTASYITAEVSTHNLTVKRIRLRAEAAGGYRGDIAIDNLKVFGTEIPVVDSDNDGMPDDWELQYGLNPQSDDSSQDPDNDGLSNIEEYTMGTNPTVAAESITLTHSALGQGLDGGDANNGQVDGTFDEELQLGSKVIIQKHRNITNFNRTEWRAAAEFNLPSAVANGTKSITSAKIITTLEGRWGSDGLVSYLQLHGYTGNASFELADLSQTSTVAGSFNPNSVSPGTQIEIDITGYTDNLTQGTSVLGLVFSIFSYSDRVDLSKDIKLELEIN